MIKTTFRVGDVVRYAFDANPTRWQRIVARVRSLVRNRKQRFFQVTRVEDGEITIEVVEG